MPIVATVLKTGGQYTIDHVNMLDQQLDVPLIVYTDDKAVLADRGDLARKLTGTLPGWWSKMELFDPGSREDMVYFDLDTVIRKRPRVLDAPIHKPMILRDVYRTDGLQSSIMVIPAGFKPLIWNKWSVVNDTRAWAKVYAPRNLGDQAFIEDCGKQFWGILQDAYPGEYVSWKADNLDGRPLPDEARVIVFHGEPKPWSVPRERQSWR